LSALKALKLTLQPYYPDERKESPKTCLLLKLGMGSSFMLVALLLNVQHLLPVEFLQRHATDISITSASLLQFFLGLPLYWHVLTKPKQNSGKLPLALASLLAYGFTLYQLNQGIDSQLYFTASIIIYIATLLTYLEYRSIDITSQPLVKVKKWGSDQAFKKVGRQFEVVATSTLKKGDIVKIKAGEMIPQDGIIVSGTTSVDESSLTGGFKPLLKEKGDFVVGFTINRDSEITIELTKDQAETIYAKMIYYLDKICHGHPPIYKKLEIYSQSVTFIGILTALIVFYYQFILSSIPLPVAFRIALTTLISFSAFSLTPTAIMATHNFLGLMIRRGILIKKGKYIELLGRLKTLYFDKTGTLTKGDFEYSESFIEMGTNQGKFLSTIFSLESQSNHPFSEAIETHPWFNEIPKHEVKDFKIHPGLGVCATIQPKAKNGFFAAVGNLRFLKRMQMFITRDMKYKMDDLETIGETVLLCGYDRHVIGLISFSDTLRPHVTETLKAIQKLKIEPAIITGDSEEAITHLAEELEIKKIYARCTPEEKAAKIGREINLGNLTGFVGNQRDEVAFTKADISISTDTGSDILNQNANVVIMGSDFRLLSWLLQKSKAYVQTINFNMIISTFFIATYATLSILDKVKPEFITVFILMLNLLILRSASQNKDKNVKEREKCVETKSLEYEAEF